MVDLNTIVPPESKPDVPKYFSEEQLGLVSESTYRTMRNYIISEVYNSGNLMRGQSGDIHKKNLDSYVKELIPMVETSGGRDLSETSTETAFGIKPNTWAEMLEDSEELIAQLPAAHGKEFIQQINDWHKYVKSRGLKNAPNHVLEPMVMAHLWMSMGSTKTQPQARRDIAGVLDGRESAGVSLYMHSYYRGNPSHPEYQLAKANIKNQIKQMNWGSTVESAESKSIQKKGEAEAFGQPKETPVIGAPQGKKAHAAAYGDIGAPPPGITGASMDSTYPVGE